MNYDIHVPNKEQDGWLVICNRGIENDLQTGDYLELSKREIDALKCSAVKIIGRVISTDNNVQLFCRPVENYYIEMMNKIFAR